MDICSAEEPFLRLMVDGTVISTRLIGAYNAANVLAAIAVGDYFGIPREESIAAVESFVPDNERSEMRRTQKNALIFDIGCIQCQSDFYGRGAGQLRAHAWGRGGEAGTRASRRDARARGGLEYEVVDEEGKVAAKNSRSGEGNSPFVWTPTSEALLKYLRAHSVEGRLVLIKGSRSTQMEKVIPAL